MLQRAKLPHSEDESSMVLQNMCPTTTLNDITTQKTSICISSKCHVRPVTHHRDGTLKHQWNE